jgi:hypothetical protein
MARGPACTGSSKTAALTEDVHRLVARTTVVRKAAPRASRARVHLYRCESAHAALDEQDPCPMRTGAATLRSPAGAGHMLPRRVGSPGGYRQETPCRCPV